MEHNIDKLKKNVEGRGWSFKCFASGAEAADYLAGELASSSVGIGGCTTADSIGLYEKLTPVCPEVVWHWKADDDASARRGASVTEAYVCGTNAISETGEVVNIDRVGNRTASTLYVHKRLYIIAGKNKVCPDLESAIHRARNVAGPLRTRSMGRKMPCARGELKCWDCRSPERICRGMSILMMKMTGMEKSELILIDEELGM